jgi:DNA-binding GntR family transcriptional regulator
MASRIGSVREVVSRAISRLEQDGLIRLEDHRIRIPDLQRLSEYLKEN